MATITFFPDNKTWNTIVVVQWHHLQIGLIPSEKILTVAEKLGFHRSLEQSLIQSACQQLQSWQRCQIFTRLILPISEPTLNKPDFLYPLIQCFQTLRLNPKYIEVEIPTTTLLQTSNIKTIASKVLALKSVGIFTTLAQFGRGRRYPLWAI